MRVALVHDWLIGMRGGERCLEALCEIFPTAPLYTLVHRPGGVSPGIEAREIHTSFVQRLPGATRRHQRYLPLFPSAIERFDLSSFDLVVSTSHCAAKGARAPDGAAHLSFCFTPMRYVWDQYDAYWSPRTAGALTRAVMPALARRLRAWDVESASRVTAFATTSEHVRRRIQRFWAREADVLGMFIDAERFRLPAPGTARGYDVVLSALVPYKRVDLAVEAATRTGRPLVVVGSGVERARLERMAGPNVTFTGWVSDAEAARWIQGARILFFPGEEDFGLVPLEAIACGTPVVAYGRGGALETVEEGATGTFFSEQTVEALIDARERAERVSIDPAELPRRLAPFTRDAFKRRFLGFVARATGAPESSLAVPA